MEIDQFTKKRLEKLFNEMQHEQLNNPKQDVSTFAGGVYVGMLKTLAILDIKVEGRTHPKKL